MGDKPFGLPHWELLSTMYTLNSETGSSGLLNHQRDRVLYSTVQDSTETKHQGVTFCVFACAPVKRSISEYDKRRRRKLR